MFVIAPPSMRIPIDSLEPETLRRVVEEFVTRDGTDLSEMDVTVEQVLRQLQQGKAELHFEPEEETTTIVAVRP